MSIREPGWDVGGAVACGGGASGAAGAGAGYQFRARRDAGTCAALYFQHALQKKKKSSFLFLFSRTPFVLLRLSLLALTLLQRKDWLALVAVHSDAWLMAVAFYYGAKFDGKER